MPLHLDSVVSGFRPVQSPWHALDDETFLFSCYRFLPSPVCGSVTRPPTRLYNRRGLYLSVLLPVDACMSLRPKSFTSPLASNRPHTYISLHTYALTLASTAPFLPQTCVLFCSGSLPWWLASGGEKLGQYSLITRAYLVVPT